MANISIIAFSHDYGVGSDKEDFATAMKHYFSSGDKMYLPQGAQLIEMHHSYDPSIIQRRTILIEKLWAALTMADVDHKFKLLKERIKQEGINID